MQFSAIPPHCVIATLLGKIGDKNSTEYISSTGLNGRPIFTTSGVLQLPVRLAFEEHLKSGQVQEIHSPHAQNIDFCSLSVIRLQLKAQGSGHPEI